MTEDTDWQALGERVEAQFPETLGRLGEGSRDPMGDRMKAYEWSETHRAFGSDSIVIVRLDGRGFSNFTRSMIKPYDERLASCMIDAAKVMMRAAHSKLAYTQSDELTLVMEPTSELDSVFFAGKKQKMVSVLAGLMSSAFMKAVVCHSDPSFTVYAERMPHFDCRAFEVPSRTEAANAVLWRVRDAERNAVSMAAQAHFDHRALHRKSTRTLREMLLEKGIDFERHYPVLFQHGATLHRRIEYVPAVRLPGSPNVPRTRIDVADPPERITFAWMYEAIFQQPPPEGEA